MRFRVLGAVALVFTILATERGFATPYTFAPSSTQTPAGFFVEGPGSSTALKDPAAQHGTEAYGSNDVGQTVGTYDGTKSFLYSNGIFTDVTDPAGIETDAYAINDAGEIVGRYWDANLVMHGFVDIGGVFTTVDVPASFRAVSTALTGINNAGQVVGNYYTSPTQFAFFIATPAAQDVPEPTGLGAAMLGAGLAGGLLMSGRRRRTGQSAAQ
jgi:hypothetical protein